MSCLHNIVTTHTLVDVFNSAILGARVTLENGKGRVTGIGALPRAAQRERNTALSTAIAIRGGVEAL